LYIVLPRDYIYTAEKYPVVFTTDPNFILGLLNGMFQSLRSMIPSSIIVGIGHADLDFKELDQKSRDNKLDIHRTRDFLPHKFKLEKYLNPDNDPAFNDELMKNACKAENFKDFILTEVIPFIDEKYRTQNSKTLVGHSFGGVFGLYIASNFTSVFQKYIIMSPVLDVENEFILDEINNFDKTVQTKIYISLGEMETVYSSNKNLISDFNRLKSKIDLLPNVDVELEIFKNQYHASVVPFALSNGLRFVNKE
jgi:predicted alpha/beta superfamily hydrolase